jgi:ATP-dependent RNA helicase DeaD
MTDFKELGVEESILKGIAEMGFENATPVQEKVIPVLLEEQGDLVALAQTGTGKTAAFGLPIIQKAEPWIKKIQSVILSPTRELCLQISKDLKKYSKYKDGIEVLAVYGGTDIRRQITSLRKGVQVLVATPGRLLDLINRGEADLAEVSTVVLDEADEMLNMGFKEDLNAILENTPDWKKTLLFSATMPKEVEAISRNYMNNPQSITVGRKNQGSDNVSHSYCMVKAKDCYEALKRFVESNPDMYAIVFCRTRQDTRDVARKLVRDGFDADALHGDLSQHQRDSVMYNFRYKRLKLLVATDVAARGLDVDNLTHVFNYNLPEDIESYTHRSGRTGRAGRKGEAIAILHSREKGKLRRIENTIKKKFEFKPVPSGEDVCKSTLSHYVTKLHDAEVDEEHISPFMDKISDTFEDMSKEDLIKKMISMEFDRMLSVYKNAEDINISEKEMREGDRDRGRRGKDSAKNGYCVYSINLGRKDGLQPGDIFGIINRMTKTRGIDIGSIKIFNDFCRFEVEIFHEKTIEKASKQPYKFKGKEVDLKKSKSSGVTSKYGKRRGNGGKEGRNFDGNRGFKKRRKN